MQADLALYFVLDPVQCSGHARALDIAREALEGGATIVQRRAPEWHRRAWFSLDVDLLPITREFGVPLIIDDRIATAQLRHVQSTTAQP